MKRSFSQDLFPSAVLALGIVAGQALASDLAGCALLGLALLAADALSGRMRGGPSRAGGSSWMLAAAFVLAGCLGSLRAPGHDESLIPLLGLGAWTVFFMGDRARRTSCTSASTR